MRFATARKFLIETAASAIHLSTAVSAAARSSEPSVAIAAVLARIARRFRKVGMVLGLSVAACQSPATPPKEAPAVQLPVTTEAKPDESPRLLGDFNVTFYYVTSEDEVEASRKAKAEKLAAKAAAAQALIASYAGNAANDNENSEENSVLASALTPIEPAEPELVHVYGPECESLAEVSREFAAALTLQGTGKLRDGRVINVWGKCSCERSPCFKITENQWGTGGGGRPLQPFRTVAVDPKVIKLGTLLYVPILDGRTMPGRAPWGGFVHDGCVIADDTGGGIDGNQLDLFVGRKGYYLGVSGSAGSHSWAKHVPVYDGASRCQREGRKVTRKSGSI